MEFLATLVFFGLCTLLMSLGVILSGKILKGSCGGVATNGGQIEITDGCGICSKKKANVCPSSDENGELVKIASLGMPFKRKNPP